MDNLSEESEELKVAGYDFSGFKNVEITGIDLTSLDENQLSVLYVQARYCQAMTDADIDTMREIVSEDVGRRIRLCDGRHKQDRSDAAAC